MMNVMMMMMMMMIMMIGSDFTAEAPSHCLFYQQQISGWRCVFQLFLGLSFRRFLVIHTLPFAIISNYIYLVCLS